MTEVPNDFLPVKKTKLCHKKDNIKKDNESNRVDSLDYFLNEDEINKKN